MSLMKLKHKYRRYNEPRAWLNRANKKNVQMGRASAGGNDPQQHHKATKKGVAPARALSGRSGSPYRRRKG